MESEENTMKYSEKMIKDIMYALKTAPIHTWWDIAIVEANHDTGYCKISFHDLDNNSYSIVFAGNAANIINNGKWSGSYDYKNTPTNSFYMWFGMKLDELYRKNH